jgi:hypothetical protein
MSWVENRTKNSCLNNSLRVRTEDLTNKGTKKKKQILDRSDLFAYIHM